MRKLHLVSMKMSAALGLAAVLSISIAPPANAGKKGCAALIEAAQNGGYRGDRTALLACQSAAHAAKTKPRALQSQATRETNKLHRDLRRAHRAVTSHDARTAAQLRGQATARIIAKNVGHDERHRQRNERLQEAAGNAGTVLEAITGIGLPH